MAASLNALDFALGFGGWGAWDAVFAKESCRGRRGPPKPVRFGEIPPATGTPEVLYSKTVKLENGVRE